jgi:BirA family transcriptional regulator, biotin operon repressor / biotin---[acetyl-CoA-carboxylase] ligase
LSRYTIAAEAAHLGLVYLPECVSTNDYALASPETNCWFVTDNQTAGRGRMNRPWVSPAGNLACSLKISDEFKLANLPQLAFVSAFALREALKAHDLASGTSFKWPNDLLYKGNKCAGILIEASTKGKKTTVVIGIGVNLGEVPNIPRETESFKGLITPQTLFNSLTKSFQAAYKIWNYGAGFEVIRGRYRQAAHGLGEQLTFDLNGEQLTGRFIDITTTGSLLFETIDGIREIIAGEIVRFGNVDK